MLTIKANTKKAENLIEKANHYQGTELYEIYGKYSTAKAKAIEHCKALCKHENGYNFRIISHTAQRFSVAWELIDDATGVIIATRIETGVNSYFVEIA
jgi:hypothetical protein